MKVFFSALIILGITGQYNLASISPSIPINENPPTKFNIHYKDSCNTTDETVYICTGPKSECYHSTSSCQGLKACSTTIKAVSIEKAKEMNRRKCKWCYK